MHTTRLEIFSDAVIAIAMTIMVLELKIPHGSDWVALHPLVPTFLAYILSFIYLGIYWNNHHHLLHLAEHVDGRVMWANLHLLFWLSLVPFVTGWMTENEFASFPTAMYGLALLLSAFAYLLLQKSLIAHHGKNSKLAEAIHGTRKETISLIAYALAIALAFIHEDIAIGLYVLVALMWLVPDSRIERKVSDHHDHQHP